MDVDDLVATVERMRALGTDDQRVEVKGSVGQAVLSTLSAFSNGDGGVLVIGLSEEDGFRPVPSFDPVAEQDRLTTMCQKLTPTVRPFIDFVEFEGRPVMIARVEPMGSRQRPCYVTARGRYGGSYLRTGDGDQRLQKYEVDRLIEEQTQPRWDEAVVSAAGLSDLDRLQLDRYLEDQRVLRPKTFSEGREVALRRLGLVIGAHPTLAGLLSLGAYPQEWFPKLSIAFTEYPGTSKGDLGSDLRLVDKAIFEGSIPAMVEASVAKVASNMRTAGRVEGAFRRDLPDYPLVAVREAVTNALMHRDYSPDAQGTQVQINLYVDRLEISNPGGLYGPVTLRTLGRANLSSSRNQRLSTLLESVTFPGGGSVAENRGTGIAVMQSQLSKALMPPPEFRDDLSSFTVVFRRRSVAPEEEYLSAEDRVERVLWELESASTRELREQLDLSRTAVQNSLNSLIEKGKVERTEPTRSPKQRYRRRRA